MTIILQALKRKERDMEHEKERLAKEKIARQKTLSSLRREMPHIDIDSTLLPDIELNGVRERGKRRRASRIVCTTIRCIDRIDRSTLIARVQFEF